MDNISKDYDFDNDVLKLKFDCNIAKDCRICDYCWIYWNDDGYLDYLCIYPRKNSNT